MRTTRFVSEAEHRWSVQVIVEEKDEYLNPKPVSQWEIPKSLSMSGWMRNDREAFEYLWGHPSDVHLDVTNA